MVIAERDLEEIDQFLADQNKILIEPQPDWIHHEGYHDWQLTWPIMEETLGKTRASLKFRIPENNFFYPSINLIFRNEIVARLDKVEDEKEKPNPVDAHKLGLCGWIKGTHIHDWQDNRTQILVSQSWELPYRRPVTDHLRDLNHMYFWFCDKMNVRLQGSGTRLDLPSKTFFGGENA